MFLVPAKEVAMGDLILTKGAVAERKTVRYREVMKPGQIGFFDYGWAGYYRPDEEVLVIRKGTTPSQTHEERHAELTELTTTFLHWLGIDREDDGSTDMLIAMYGAAHRLKEKLQEVYCSGDHPCFPSGNREPRS